MILVSRLLLPSMEHFWLFGRHCPEGLSFVANLKEVRT
nr:MAG TPA_asm: hypothetical protein [Caudoviricetes sp.]